MATRAHEPWLQLELGLDQLDRFDAQPRLPEEVAPLLFGVIADVGRVAQAFCLLDFFPAVDVVDHEDEASRHASHLPDRSRHVVEMVRRDPTGDDVERGVRKRKLFGAADHVRLFEARIELEPWLERAGCAGQDAKRVVELLQGRIVGDYVTGTRIALKGRK